MEFATERLYLRPLGLSDEALYCRIYIDPDLMRHIGPPLSRPAARRAFAVACRQPAGADPTTHLWAIDWQAMPIGIAACVRSSASPDAAELGLMLVEEAQGSGVATEALTALTDRVFAAFQLRRVWTRHAPENVASVRLMRRMRFSPLLTTDDEVRWQMLHSPWNDLRAMAGSQRRPAGGAERAAWMAGWAEVAADSKLAAGASVGRE